MHDFFLIFIKNLVHTVKLYDTNKMYIYFSNLLYVYLPYRPLTNVIKALYTQYRNLHFTYLEINPLGMYPSR